MTGEPDSGNFALDTRGAPLQYRARSGGRSFTAWVGSPVLLRRIQSRMAEPKS